MASVRKKRSASGAVIYQAIWREAGLNGARIQKTKNFGRAADARAHAARMEQEVEQRGVGDPDKHATGQFLRRWLATLEHRGEHSPTTLAGYRRHVEMASREIGEIPLARLTTQDLDRAYGKLLKSGGVSRDGKGDAAPAFAADRASPASLPAHRLRAGAQVEARRREPGPRCDPAGAGAGRCRSNISRRPCGGSERGAYRACLR